MPQGRLDRDSAKCRENTKGCRPAVVVVCSLHGLVEALSHTANQQGQARLAPAVAMSASEGYASSFTQLASAGAL